MFAKEVSKYCKSNGDPSITKCKHDLLTFGVAKLEKMNESHLDAMDPYQRSANDISKYLFIFFFCNLLTFKSKTSHKQPKSINHIAWPNRFIERHLICLCYFFLHFFLFALIEHFHPTLTAVQLQKQIMPTSMTDGCASSVGIYRLPQSKFQFIWHWSYFEYCVFFFRIQRIFVYFIFFGKFSFK